MVVREQIAQPVRYAQHELADGDERDDVVGQMRGERGHAFSATARAKTAAFATQCNQALEVAIGAAKATETARENSAIEKARQLAFDKGGNTGAVVQLTGAMQKIREVVLHHLI